MDIAGLKSSVKDICIVNKKKNKNPSWHSAYEMEKLLEQYPQYQEKLYYKGFMITDMECNLTSYPFYSNWTTDILRQNDNCSVYLYSHKNAHAYTYTTGDVTFFLIGHAYDPFSMLYDEHEILVALSHTYTQERDEFWKRVSDLTGVFFIGVLTENEIIFSADCTGMQLCYYGKADSHFFLTSHSKLTADLCGWSQDDYIVRLVNSRFYHYWGTFLPADCSPFRELKRVQPNFEHTLNLENLEYTHRRYFPLQPIAEVSQEEYEDKIAEIGDVLCRTMELIAKKWPDRRAAISVTGGRDSTMTLSSAKNVYQDLGYFSYISNEAEKVDAAAAHQICHALNLKHKIYRIPEAAPLYKDIDVVKSIFECNAGCIGHNNENDIRKRICLNTVTDFDVEVKSWVDELCRGEAQNKYNTLRFPKRPTPGYYRCMWKVIADPRLIFESNRIFRDYLNRYYDENVWKCMSWTDLFYWEFSWGAGEGMFLTSEHRYSSEITIPYNNRHLLSIMFQIPEEQRIQHRIPIDVIRYNDRRIEDSKVFVKDIAHTDMWSFIIRTYLRIFSKF